MVDSQDMNQAYGDEHQQHQHRNAGHQQQQQAEECEAALLSSIVTADLMDLDSDIFIGLDQYQDSIKLESFPSMDQTDFQQPETPSTPMLPPAAVAALEHLNKAPSLDEVHDPAFNFNVDLNGESSGKSSWMFSSRLNKVFVKMGQPCTFNVSYQVTGFQQPQLPQMQVRAMLICSSPEDLYQPVYRCENHRGNDRSNPNLSPSVIAHVMRCFNPLVRYVGTEQGVAFKDRLAIVVPLDSTVQEQTVNSNISLEFVCQNSCRIINRRPTAIIFTLEDGNGQILGKKSLHLKVCSCPKRDKQKEEETLAPATKRKSDCGPVAPPGKKVAKLCTSHRSPSGGDPIPAGKLAFIKKEHHSPGSPVPSSRSTGSTGRALTPLNSAELVEQTATTIAVPMPSVSAAVKVAEYAFQVVAGDLVRCVDDDQRKHLAAYLTQIRRLQSKYQQFV